MLNLATALSTNKIYFSVTLVQEGLTTTDLKDGKMECKLHLASTSS